MAAVLLAPAAATIYLAFRQGGFFPNGPAFLAIVLLQLLVLRALLAERPFEGIGATAGVVIAALAGFAVWQLLSAAWSESVGRSLVEFDRTLLYLATFVLFASLGRTSERVAWLIRLLAATFTFICVLGLVSRALPDILTVSTDYAPDRLSYPVTYWNALGLMAALAIVLLVHLTCSGREPLAVRIGSAAALPAVAAALVLTYSRAGVLLAIVGVAGYCVAGRPRTLLSGLLATGPFVAVAVAATYGAEALARSDYVTKGVDEGHDLAAMLAACIVAAGIVRAVLLAVLDGRLIRKPLAPVQALGVRPAIVWGTAALVVLVVALAAGVPGKVGDQYDRFVKGDAGPTGDTRDRLTDFANGGRIEQWDIALDGWSTARLKGHGAGTYQTEFYARRTDEGTVTDGHSLYLEALDELGLVGLLLIVVALGTIVAGLARGLRGRYRSRSAALLAVIGMWIVAAGLDWHWEMPVVTLWVFAAGGLLLARRVTPHRRGEATMTSTSRAVVAAGWLVAVLAPLLILMSTTRIEEAGALFNRGECPAARTKALSSLDYLSARPEPYAIVGFCAAFNQFPEAAADALRKARDRDPENWEYHLGLAAAAAAAGRDPSAELAEATRLNPRDTLVRKAGRRLRAARTPAQRREAGQHTFDDIFFSYKLTIQNL
jgi:O-antigen ligase